MSALTDLLDAEGIPWEERYGLILVKPTHITMNGEEHATAVAYVMPVPRPDGTWQWSCTPNPNHIDAARVSLETIREDIRLGHYR